MIDAQIGVVLAGGRATRMGGDKAGAILAGQTLLARAVNAARAAGLEVRVCARADTVLPPISGLAPSATWREPTRGDGTSDAHPLAGVAHALREAGEPIVVLPVDLPLLPPSVLSTLASHPARLTVVSREGRPAALVGRFDPAAADELSAAAAAGAPALRTLVELGAALVELAELLPAEAAARALTNVNGPDDLLAVEQLLAGHRADVR